MAGLYFVLVRHFFIDVADVFLYTPGFTESSDRAHMYTSGEETRLEWGRGVYMALVQLVPHSTLSCSFQEYF